MSGEIGEVARALAGRAQSVAEMLLPQGKKVGAEWEAGSIFGDKGRSLKVRLSGAKAGVWADFNGGDKSGDLLDLWAITKNLTIAQALDEARDYLGIVRQKPTHEPKRTYKRPEKRGSWKPVRDHALDYLTQDRNIPGEILTKYRVASENKRIVFPFLLPDGTLALAKLRDPEDGARTVPSEGECEPILFGWQAIPDDARQVVLTEGEIDALSWAAYGFPAMSVPFGGGKGEGKHRWIEGDYERMDRFDRIYLSMDMDEVGEQAAEYISSRLGRHRCYRVKLPRKDANQCLVEGISPDEMASFIREAQPLDPEGLRSGGEYYDELERLFWPTAEDHPGYSTPYSTLGDKLRFRAAEVTLWSGASGMGKSQVLSDCTPHWIKQGSRVCIASFEMRGKMTMKRLVKQAGGVDRPTPAYLRQITDFIGYNVLIYEKVGKSDVSKLLEIFDYARAKYGCDQFIIDSLMRLGIASDDYVGQEKAVFEIVDWTIKHNVHTHLVAHARKSAPGQGAPEIEDIKGAMEIGANAFNIVTIWRDRALERKIEKAKTDVEREELAEQPPVILNVAKQRNGDWEGRIGLWFDRETYRYSTTHNRALWGRQYLEVKQLLPDEIAA
jgi:twinkle protein